MSRARVFMLGRVHTDPLHRCRCRPLWAFEVRDNEGKVVLADNCTSLPQIHDMATRGAAAVDLINSAGHTLRYSFRQLVDRVAEGKS